MISTMLRRSAAAFSAALLCAAIAPWQAAAQRELTLRDAIDIAMEKSPEIRNVRYNLESREARLAEAEAALKSQLSLDITPFRYSKTRQFQPYFSTYYDSDTKSSEGTFTIMQPIRWTDGELTLRNTLGWQDAYSEANDRRDKSFRNDLYLTFSQPLFTYNRSKQEIRSLELDLEGVRLEYARRLLDLEYEVMRDFYGVYRMKKSLEIAQEGFNDTEKYYYITKDKVEAGLDTEEQLWQTEYDLALRRSRVREARVDLENALDDFKNLLGLPLEEELDVVADISFTQVEVPLERAVEHGLKYRTEIREGEIAIEQAKMNLVAAGAENEFAGSMNLSYGVSGTAEEFGDIYDERTQTQGIGLSFSIPLWDWGKKRHRLRASEIEVLTSGFDLEDLRKEIVIEIRKTYRRLENQVVQIELARQNVRNARLTYEISLENYKSGKLDSKLLGDKQQQLESAKNEEINTLIEYKLLLQQLKINSLWDFEKNESVIEEL